MQKESKNIVMEHHKLPSFGKDVNPTPNHHIKYSSSFPFECTSQIGKITNFPNKQNSKFQQPSENFWLHQYSFLHKKRKMNEKSAVPLKHKFFHPCKRMVQQHLSKLRFRKPLFIRGLLRFRQIKGEQPKKLKKRRGFFITKFLSVSFFQCFSKKEMDDRVMELKSFSDVEYNKAPFPSPLTPAYVRMSATAGNRNNNRREGVAVQQEVEDACRCFENYLMEMIMEEGKTRDLMDVEELLHCWKNLKSPVFIDLVCRFYAELCRDLFSNHNSC